MIIETIVATLIGVIVSRLYIGRYYILVKKSDIKEVNIYNKEGKRMRHVTTNISEFLREDG